METNAFDASEARMAVREGASQVYGPTIGIMRHFLRIFPLALVLLGAVLLFERPAYAYADPGTGLLAVQAAGSALVAAGWYLRRKIYALFHRGAAKSQESDAPNPANNEDSPQP
jgi:hypothetical protein